MTEWIRYLSFLKILHTKRRFISPRCWNFFSSRLLNVLQIVTGKFWSILSCLTIKVLTQLSVVSFRTLCQHRALREMLTKFDPKENDWFYKSEESNYTVLKQHWLLIFVYQIMCLTENENIFFNTDWFSSNAYLLINY